ncbi:hypothetical protein BRADI_5g14946v3, partial [Brachypodium distachyon]
LRLWSGAHFPIPGSIFCSSEECWTEARKRVPKSLRRDFDTFTILVHWRLWKERNARIFQQEAATVERVVDLIIEDLRSWKAAGCIVAI